MMSLIDPVSLKTYWSDSYLGANVFVLLNLLGALLLGLFVGYERTFRGRAAGMRTYGLVCMTSAALTVLVGLPSFWYGGQAHVSGGDPTRVIQGVVTGVGFLGSGVIMRDGLQVSGLTTAASIWAAAAIGILVGTGFYGASIMLALACVISMEWVRRLEAVLPTHPVLKVKVTFRSGFTPQENVLFSITQGQGFSVSRDSLSISFRDGQPEWHFDAVSMNPRHGVSATGLAEQLARMDGVVSFSVSPNQC